MSRSEQDRVLPSTVHATAARQSGATEALDTLDRLQTLQALNRKTAADWGSETARERYAYRTEAPGGRVRPDPGD